MIKSIFFPALGSILVILGIPAYVYTSYMGHQAAAPQREVFCLSQYICEGSADACRLGAAPLYFKRAEDFTGYMRFDNGRTLIGDVTAVAGQASGRFSEHSGATWELEVFSSGEFTLMGRIPDLSSGLDDKTIETYYQGNCEKVIGDWF